MVDSSRFYLGGQIVYAFEERGLDAGFGDLVADGDLLMVVDVGGNVHCVWIRDVYILFYDLKAGKGKFNDLNHHGFDLSVIRIFSYEIYEDVV